MNRIVIFIPENIYINYFVYNMDLLNPADGLRFVIGDGKQYELLASGKIKFRGSMNSKNEIMNLIKNYKPDFSAIKVIYGGNDFKEPVICNDLILKKLERLVPHSPLDTPLIIELIKILMETMPSKEIKLFFETAFFNDLPVYEQLYAVDDSLINMEIRRSGYHGLFHNAVLERINGTREDIKKIISICMEPVPEVAAILNGRPVMISGGATPVEGLPGETTCGELDPGILLLIEEKKKLGAEKINDIITRESGLSAIAGKRITIRDIFTADGKYKEAEAVFKYKLLLSCGSAIAAMNGFDAVSFSGRYIDVADKIAGWLIPELKRAAAEKFNPEIFYCHDRLEEIIAGDYLKAKEESVDV